MAILKYKNKETGEWESIPALQGADGKSAYEIALYNGFEGTEEEWLDSLKGANGKDGTNGTNGENGKDGVDGEDGIGIINTEISTDGELVIYYSDNTSRNVGKIVGSDGQDGANGSDGNDGKSAYEIARDKGFEGSEKEWLESLKSRVEVVTIMDFDTAAQIEEQFWRIYNNENNVILQYGDDSMENTRTYYLMRGYLETSERIFASIDVDNQIHIIKYTNFGADREIYTQNTGRTEVITIFDDDYEEEIQMQRDSIGRFMSNYNDGYIYPFVINYNGELYTLSRVSEDSSYVFVCATEKAIKQIEYKSDNTRVYSETNFDTFITSDYFDSAEFAEKVIAALPVAETTAFPIEEATV